MKQLLAIFDLDGTLYDTKQVNYYAYKEALRKLSIELSEDFFFAKCFGRHYKQFLSEIVKDNDSVENVHALKQEYYSKNLNRARKNSQLFNLIEGIRNNYYIVIVTTASRKNTMDILTSFGDDTCFDLIITADDVAKVKPDPEGFFTAMNHFNIKAESTIIFEDSKIGIEAAKASGATVFSVEQF